MFIPYIFAFWGLVVLTSIAVQAGRIATTLEANTAMTAGILQQTIPEQSPGVQKNLPALPTQPEFVDPKPPYERSF